MDDGTRQAIRERAYGWRFGVGNSGQVRRAADDIYDLLAALEAAEAEIGRRDHGPQLRDYEDTLCAIHHGIDHPDGRSDETADFYMAVGWYTGQAEAVLDKYGLIARSGEEAGEGA